MNIEHPTGNRSCLARGLRACLKKAAQWAVVPVLAAGFLANAQSTNDSATTDFSSFQLIVDRNIFNPDRYPRMGYHHHESQGLPTFSLAGTMIYRKGLFAFFDGSSDEYQKALQQGGTIAGYTVAKINFDGVQLQASGKTIDMQVGAAMRQEGNGWELSAPGQWGQPSSTETETDDTNESSTANLPSGAGAANDVLKRLMEQRQQSEHQ